MPNNTPPAQPHPDARQVGGRHYTAKYQHWDYVADAGLGYFEGQITKYVTRWRSKGGAQDVEKAIHYFDKLISLIQENRTPQLHRFSNEQARWALAKFFDANSVSREEMTIFVAITNYKDLNELLAVRPLLLQLLQKALVA